MKFWITIEIDSSNPALDFSGCSVDSTIDGAGQALHDFDINLRYDGKPVINCDFDSVADYILEESKHG